MRLPSYFRAVIIVKPATLFWGKIINDLFQSGGRYPGLNQGIRPAQFDMNYIIITVNQVLVAAVSLKMEFSML